VDTPLRLHVTPAEGAPFDHPLRTDSLVVGRALDADLTLSDPFLSRRHSRFFRTGADLFVEDLGSRNGTFVNGEPVDGTMRLRRGDRVQFGQTVAELLR